MKNRMVITSWTAKSNSTSSETAAMNSTPASRSEGNPTDINGIAQTEMNPSVRSDVDPASWTEITSPVRAEQLGPASRTETNSTVRAEINAKVGVDTNAKVLARSENCVPLNKEMNEGGGRKRPPLERGFSRNKSDPKILPVKCYSSSWMSDLYEWSYFLLQ